MSFCNVPVIVLSEHVGGIKNINPVNGKLVPSTTKDTIKEMLNNLNSYTPMEWALKNISCTVTTEKLNNYLK